KQISDYKGTTFGLVTEYLDSGWRSDSLLFEYYVNGIKYTNRVGVSNGTDKKARERLKKKFKVHYSIKNPEYSVIDLAELEKYKRTVEFFEF
ncbi:unnamed protein product, partial [Ectocarpus sp. 12 AP-2014]